MSNDNKIGYVKNSQINDLKSRLFSLDCEEEQDLIEKTNRIVAKTLRESTHPMEFIIELFENDFMCLNMDQVQLHLDGTDDEG